MKLLMYFAIFWFQRVLKTSEAVLMPVNNSESKLLEYLLTNYSADIRPVQNHNDPVVVRFGFTLKQIVNLDVVNQILTTNVWLMMHWKNELISWDPEQFNGLKVINIKPSMLWLPDITIFNSATKTPSVGSLYKKITSQVIVRHTGEVQWLSPAIISTECKVNVRYFPFDTQICEIEFGSWTYDGLRVDLQLDSNHIDTREYSVSKEWHLHNTRAKRVVKKYNCCPEPFTSMTFQLVVKRRVTFYVFNLVFPCGLITLLSLFSFILPPNSGERVSFVMTILLSLSVYMILVTEKIPQSSDNSMASTFFLSMMVQIGCSLVATCFIIKLHNSNTPMPALFEKVINHWLASLLLMKRKNENKRSTVIRIANKQPQRVFKNSGFLKEETDLIHARLQDPRKTEFKLKNEENVERNSIATTIACQGEIATLIEEMKVISDKLRERDEEENLREEWAFATKVLDRFFICTLASSMSIACVVMFTVAVQGDETTR